MATINHKTYNEATETFKDFSVYDGKETLIFKVDGSAGSVGIGTATPAYNLHVNASGDSRIIITDSAQGSTVNDGTYVRQSGVNSSIVNQENGTLQFGTNNSFVQTILANGNVGIGTSAPALTLELNSSATAALPATTGGTQSTGGRMRLTTTGAATAVIDFGTAGGSGGWIQATNKSDLSTNYALLLNPNGGNVGIGTTSPSSKLDVNGDIAGRGSFNGFAGATHNLLIDWSSASQFTTLTATDVFFGTNANERMRITSTGDVWLKGVSTSEGHEASFDNTNADFTIYGSRYGGTGKNIQFWATGASESMRITSTGNVGIGTSAPAVKLDVAGRVNAAGNDYHSFSVDQGSAQIRLERTGTSTGVNYIGSDNRGLLITNSAFSTLAIFTANGLTFNGDTAAANALDDYEEGTWTMGVAFGGAAVGVTYSENTGTYTKIGRQVTVNGYLVLTSKGSSTGAARVTGLPFTLGGSGGNYAAASLYFYKITFTNQFSGYGVINTTTVSLEESTTLGVTSFITDADFANDSSIVFCLTYFV
jgi:hypothetical protein